MPLTGADLLINSLIKLGVKHLFSISGNQILSLYDATIGRDIDILHTRHEATAVHMADGWGRVWRMSVSRTGYLTLSPIAP